MVLLLTGYHVSRENELQNTKSFGITFFADTDFIRVLCTIVSFRWGGHNTTIPTFL